MGSRSFALIVALLSLVVGSKALSVSSWLKLGVVKGAPYASQDCASVAISDTVFVLFGCTDGPLSAPNTNFVNQAMYYCDTRDFNAPEWTSFGPAPAPAVWPPARSAVSMAFKKSSNDIIIYGGYLEDKSFSDDVWVFSLTTKTWAKMAPTGATVPGARATTWTWMNDNELLMFGGASGTNFANSKGSADSWVSCLNNE
jgi:hypothetical protein